MQKLVMALLFVPLVTIAQKKQITLGDIFKNRTFQGDNVPAFSELPLDSIIHPSDVKDETGKQLGTGDYQLSADKKRIIFFTGREPIYRRSSKSTAYLYDAVAKKTTRLNEGKIMHATLAVGSARLMGADAPPGQQETTAGFSVVIGIENPADAERIFHALAENGTVRMPLQQVRCQQWLGATAAERQRGVEALQGVVGGPTPFGRATALTSAEAERLFDRTCAVPIARNFLLYELYTRASGFRSLVDPST